MIFALSFLLMANAHADFLKSRIHFIDVSNRKGEDHLLMLENGRVVFLDYREKELLNQFSSSMKKQDLLEIEVNERNDFINVKTLEQDPREPKPNQMSMDGPKINYEPTIVPSYAAAVTIFSQMRRNYQDDSQCYNRAHIWNYEEYQRSGLNSKKLFLFFTRKYIRNYRYHWWFHVSPMVLVKEGNGVVERVIDRRYNSAPRNVRTWTNTFVYSKEACPVVAKYNDYRNNQEAQDCYLIPVSMYFWQPRDIVRRDNTGFEKKQFITSEVNWAYTEAF